MRVGITPLYIAKSLKVGHFGSAFGAKPRGLLFLWAIATLVTLGGCALGNSNQEGSVVKSCVLPTDQKATLAGKWKITPVPIAFRQGHFSETEISAMTAAADTWNSFFAASQGIPKVIDYGNEGSVRLSNQGVPSDACTMGLIQGNAFTGQVVIYKQAVWPHSGAQSTMALTSFCTRAASPLPQMYMAYMEVNYQGFFREGAKQPDLQTIITHELGHLLGLFHSCDRGSTAAGKPNCDSSGIAPEYQAAIMFPTFGFNADLSGEVKRNLNSNDQGRANCLYPASTNSTTGGNGT
jgi:hypothetical protein